MKVYLLTRLSLMLPILVGVTVLAFLVANLVPGDPARLQAGPNASEATVQNMREKLGLNDPLPVQYFRYVSNLIRLNLGVSIRTQHSVLDDLRTYFPATLELTLFAFLLSLTGGILIGTLAAIRQGTITDQVSRVVGILGVAVPSFWLAILLQMVFFLKLRVLPSSGRIGQFVGAPMHITNLYLFDSLVTANWTALGSAALHLVLPAATLSLFPLATISRTVRSSVLDVVSLDYVQTARSKGLKERIVIAKHVLRNALIPVVTMTGIIFARLLAGTVLIETVFTWPGMGLYIVNSIFAMDFPAIMGCTILVAVIVQGINLCVDISYVFLDPRIRYA